MTLRTERDRGADAPTSSASLVVWAMTCVLAGLCVALDVHARVRPPLVLVAMIGGPGWAVCSFLRIRERGLVWSVVIAAGLAVNVALSLVMVATHSWHPIGAAVLLLFGSGAVLAARSVQSAERGPGFDAAGDAVEGGRLCAMWAVTCVLAGLCVALDVHARVRPPLVLVAMIGGPGWAVCSFLRIRERGLVWSVVIAAGLAVNVALSLVMVATHSWQPVGAAVLLLFGSAAVLAARSAAIVLGSAKERAS